MNELYLKTFLTVADQRNFSRAAELLNMSQPTVSNHIQQIETHYNTKLFFRNMRNIELTEEGKTLYQYATKILNLHAEAKEALASSDSTTTLKISCSNTISEYMLPSMILQFRSTHPSILPNQLQIQTATSAEAIRAIQEDRVDLALVEGMTPNSFFYKSFYKDELVLSAPAQTPSDMLQQANWLVRERGCQVRKATEEYWTATGMEPDPQHIFEFANNQMIKEGVIRGLGIAFLSRLSIQSELQEKRIELAPFNKKTIKRYFYIVRKTRSFQSPLQKKFWNHVTTFYPLTHAEVPS